MKIGILTYHRAHNYGAMLQAYALKTFLEQQGHSVSFVDYWPQCHAREYRLIHGPIDSISRCVSVVCQLASIRRRWKRIVGFRSFENQYLALPSQPQYDQYESIITDCYDGIITGSDQIWRNRRSSMELLGFDKTYFCQTLLHPTPHISYAASMGVIQLQESEKQLLAEYTSQYRALLVREEGLKQLLDSLHRPSEVVADPTFLLNREDWNRMLPTKRFANEPYVLYYELAPSEDALLWAKAEAQRRKVKLITLCGVVHTLKRKNHIETASPLDFIHAIRDAEFVVATSFHGTAFSIIFEKQFVSTSLGQNADRVVSLLEQLGSADLYQERLISGTHYACDFHSANLKKQELVNRSKALLLDALNAMNATKND